MVGTKFIASLAVEVPAWGSYPSAVMGSNLLAYYRFSDVNSGLGSRPIKAASAMPAMALMRPILAP